MAETHRPAAETSERNYDMNKHYLRTNGIMARLTHGVMISLSAITGPALCVLLVTVVLNAGV